MSSGNIFRSWMFWKSDGLLVRRGEFVLIAVAAIMLSKVGVFLPEILELSLIDPASSAVFVVSNMYFNKFI